MMHSNKHLSDKEASSLEELLMRHIETDFRNALMFLLCLYTGARISEILALTCGDYNIEGRTLFIKGLKGSNNRELPLTLFLHGHLKRHIASLDGVATKRLFPISYSRAHQLWSDYKPCKKKMHSMRHTRAIRTYKRTKNIHLVKTVLGHKSIQNTMVYLDYVESSNSLKKALG